MKILFLLDKQSTNEIRPFVSRASLLFAVRICQDSQLTPTSSGQDPTNVHSRTPSLALHSAHVSTRKVLRSFLLLAFPIDLPSCILFVVLLLQKPPDMDASAKWLHQNTRLWTRSYLRCGYADLMSPIMTLGYGKASMITGWFLNWVVFPKLPLNLKRLQPLTKSLSLSRFLHLHQNCSPHKIKKFLSLPCHDTHVRPSSLFSKLAPFEDAVKPFQICRFYDSWQQIFCRD